MVGSEIIIQVVRVLRETEPSCLIQCLDIGLLSVQIILRLDLSDARRPATRSVSRQQMERIVALSATCADRVQVLVVLLHEGVIFAFLPLLGLLRILLRLFEFVGAVEDAVDDHDEELDEDEGNHLARKVVAVDGVVQVLVVRHLHLVEEEEGVTDDHDLDRRNEHI